MEIELKPATPYERKIFYKEEWDVKNVPDFIINNIATLDMLFFMIFNCISCYIIYSKIYHHVSTE